MRKLNHIRLLHIFVCIATVFILPEKALAQPGGPVSFQTFYDELSPYGRWIDDPEYGYVWSPDVESDFQPYATRGYWVMTQYGNTWVSDYPWGWAAFHYGRWHFDNYYGWLWVPGNEWGPAWVAWRSGGGYYGWAPLGPGVHVNVSINIPLFRWIFVPHRYIMSPRLYSYCAPRRTVVNVYNHTTVINNYYTNDNRTYVYGPRANEIEQHTRSRVRVHEVSHENRPGRTVVDNGSVRVYRPDVSSRRDETPSRITSRDNNSRSPRSSENNLVERNERGNSTGRRDNLGNDRTFENRSTGREGYQPNLERGNSQRSREARPQETPENRSYNQRAERPERSQTPATNRVYSERAERRNDPQITTRPTGRERQPAMQNQTSQRAATRNSEPSIQRSRETNQPRSSQSSSQPQRSQQSQSSPREGQERSRR